MKSSTSKLGSHHAKLCDKGLESGVTRSKSNKNGSRSTTFNVDKENSKRWRFRIDKKSSSLKKSSIGGTKPA